MLHSKFYPISVSQSIFITMLLLVFFPSRGFGHARDKQASHLNIVFTFNDDSGRDSMAIKPDQ